MVMQPPWSNPDPAPTPPAPPEAAKKPAARKAPARKAAPAATASPKAPAAEKPVKSAPKKAAAKRTAPAEVTTPPAPEVAASPPQSSERRRPARAPGAVEAAVLKELTDAGVAHSALAASALAMARNVDEAVTAAGASAAARELRIVLPLARTTVNPLSPPAATEKPADDDENDTTVVGPTRLDALRKRAAKRASS